MRQREIYMRKRCTKKVDQPNSAAVDIDIVVLIYYCVYVGMPAYYAIYPLRACEYLLTGLYCASFHIAARPAV